MSLIQILKSKVRKLLGKPDTIDTKLYIKTYSSESLSERSFYNIGAGDFNHPYWTNIDGDIEYYNKVYGKNHGIKHDLLDLQPLPVKENSAELVYTSHTIEHINNEAVQFVLDDCYRILKPGGFLRIVVPDIDIAYRALKNKDRIFFYGQDHESAHTVFPLHCINRPVKDASMEQIFIEDFAAGASEIALEGADHRISDTEFYELLKRLPKEEVFDKCISLCSLELQKKYPFRHINWFNESKLTKMLSHSGFKNIYRSGYLQSGAPVLRNASYFDGTMITSSLFMEAKK